MPPPPLERSWRPTACRSTTSRQPLWSRCRNSPSLSRTSSRRRTTPLSSRCIEPKSKRCVLPSAKAALVLPPCSRRSGTMLPVHDQIVDLHATEVCAADRKPADREPTDRQRANRHGADGKRADGHGAERARTRRSPAQLRRWSRSRRVLASYPNSRTLSTRATVASDCCSAISRLLASDGLAERQTLCPSSSDWRRAVGLRLQRPRPRPTWPRV